MYKLYCKKFHSPTAEVIKEINYDKKIKDFTYCEKLGFLFTIPETNQLGCLKSGVFSERLANGFEKMLHSPEQIHSRKNFIYVICNNGKEFIKIEKPFLYVSKIIDKKSESLVEKLTSKHNETFVIDLATDTYGRIFLCYDGINRCLLISGARLTNYVGNGYPTYATSKKAKYCSLNKPSGITCTENTVYIADSNNNCIRMVNGNAVSAVIGMPNERGDKEGFGLDARLNFPSKMTSFSDSVFFVDENKVKTFTTKNLYVKDYHVFNGNIISIQADDEKNLYVLEEL